MRNHRKVVGFHSKRFQVLILSDQQTIMAEVTSKMFCVYTKFGIEDNQAISVIIPMHDLVSHTMLGL